MMDGRKMLRLSILKNYLGAGGIEGDWVTMGVLVAKLPPKTSSKVSILLQNECELNHTLRKLFVK